MISIGLCNLLGIEGVVMVGDWLLEGHEERGAPVVVGCCIVPRIVLVPPVLGGRPA